MTVFHTDLDRFRYLYLMKNLLERQRVELYAYCLMGNHVHLLAASADPEGIPSLMRELQGQYSHRFNLDRGRTGALWQQRYRSTPVEDEEHLLGCFLYLDLNPVSARIVSHPEEYRWSSHRALALGVESGVLSPHACYIGLGDSPKARCLAYRQQAERALEAMRSLKE